MTGQASTIIPGSFSLRPPSSRPEAVASLEAQLETMHRLATAGTLSAGIAHELNNVLTPVLGYAQLARAHPDDTELQAKAMIKMERGVQTAARIVRSLLGFATGDDADSTAAADVGLVLEAAMECLARDPAKDGIELRASIPPLTEVAMRPIALQQVFINLLLNARNALQQRRGRIAVSAEHTTDSRIRISVVDTGPGIDPSVRDRLFEPFVSGSASDAVDRGGKVGSGLGLAMCRQLVREAGGDISADSPASGGACFSIILPIYRVRRAQAG